MKQMHVLRRRKLTPTPRKAKIQIEISDPKLEHEMSCLRVEEFQNVVDLLADVGTCMFIGLGARNKRGVPKLYFGAWNWTYLQRLRLSPLAASTLPQNNDARKS